MDYLKEYSVFDDLDLYDRNDLNPAEEMQLALHFITMIIKDEQFDRSSDDYMGFINLYDDGFRDPKMKQGFLLYLKYKKEFDPILNKLGFYVDDPYDADETVITQKNA